MNYRWIVHPLVEKRDAVTRLRHELNDLPEALARALVLRGIETYEQARQFFRPSLADLHDPFLMCDMPPAVERMAKAIRNRERVLVYGDYDVDGTTSTAMMTTFLRDQGVNVLYFIPHRYRDGYGLKKIGIDFAVNAGAELIIALDCGITGHEVASYARSRDIDLIICDHHTAGDTVPEAVAVLDPKRPDCCYPFKELSGCGVGFKLIQATLEYMDRSTEEANAYLDFVALSIASDIVPILDENRLLMSAGLDTIRDNPRMPLVQLARRSRLNLQRCSTGQIVFGIGPRINAAGRMGDARLAVELLLSNDKDHAMTLAEELEKINEKRRDLDRQTLHEAVQLAESSSDTCMKHALVLHKDNWHLGVIGIVASRLVERFHRPVILLSSVDGQAKGSARSIMGINIYDALKTCEPLLTQFGGHAYAAGLTLPEANIDPFRERFNTAVQDVVTPQLLAPEIEVDAELDLNHIDGRFWSVLKQFAPFGPENLNPIFLGRNLRVVGHPNIVGNGHIKFCVAQQGDPARSFDVIGFKMHRHMPTVRAATRGLGLDMLFTIEENSWGGKTDLQLKLKDVRSSEDSNDYIAS